MVEQRLARVCPCVRWLTWVPTSHGYHTHITEIAEKAPGGYNTDGRGAWHGFTSSLCRSEGEKREVNISIRDTLEHIQFFVNLVFLCVSLDVLDILLWRRFFNPFVSSKVIPDTQICQSASNPYSKSNEEASNKRMVGKENSNKNYSSYRPNYCEYGHYPIIRHIVIPFLDKLLDKVLRRIIRYTHRRSQPKVNDTIVRIALTKIDDNDISLSLVGLHLRFSR